jgi:hypothetical protein
VSKALATSRKTAPLSLFSLMSMEILSTRRVSYSAVLCLGLKPNCSLRSSPRSLTSLRILQRRISSNNLPIVPKRLMGRYDKGSAGSFPGFRIENTRACFQDAGNYCIRRIALNNTTRRETTLSVRCFKALFGIPSEPETLPNLGPRIVD